MNWLDYLLIAFLAISVFSSFRRGFTREAVGLCAAIASLILGMWFYATAGAMLRPWVSSERAARFLGFLLVVFAVLLAGAIAGWILRRFVKAIGLSFFDRLLGAGFGLIRGAVIAMALLTAYMAFGPRGNPKAMPSAVVHSQIAPPLMKVSAVFVEAAPMELKQNFREVYDEAQLEMKGIAQSAARRAANDDSGKK